MITAKSTSCLVAALGLIAALNNMARADAVIYEPFDYPAGVLNGQSGASEIGLDGTWSNSNNTTMVTAGSLSYGTLPTTGGKVSNLSGGQNRFAGTRSVSASALAGNGLLNDGATLWFSAEMGYDTGGNVTNSRLSLALANSSFNAGNNAYRINDEGLQLGEGLGVTLGRFGGQNGKIVATEFQDLTQGTGSNGAGNILGTQSPVLFGAGDHGLIVGKITWGAVNDTIELYLADETDLTLGPVLSTLTTVVNQSVFDTITFARGDRVVLDEIRFGATLDDVLGVTTPVPEPASVALWSILGLGLAVSAYWRKRRSVS